jgi:ATP-binding cassette subfamily B (MDR/TAP) protein 1
MLEAQASSSLKSVLKTSSLYAASQGGMLLASALGFWYGGTLIASGDLAIEAFFICFIAVTFGAQAAGGIFSHAPDMGKSKQAAESLKNLFDRVPEIDSWSEEGDKLENVQGALEFRDVHFRYPTRMSQPVLRGISLRFEPGEYVALVGASGCGKSTVISLLERFYNPQSGSILLDGQEISQLNLHNYRSQIALVSQEPVLYSGTIRENILLGSELETSEDAVVRACKDANIYDFIVSKTENI